MTIQPANALYIKLGGGGEWEYDCIEISQTLRLGYHSIDHEMCMEGNWDKVLQIQIDGGTDPGAATRHTNQIRHFYEAGKDVLWMTFYRNRLWWCFSEPSVLLLNDGSKVRHVIGQWNSKDSSGENELWTSNLSAPSGK